jgi:putative multiple sugar transport system permease protein
VFVLAVGMLLCILTGGNIDLSVGSMVCFVGAIGGNHDGKTENFPMGLAIIAMLAVIGTSHRCMAGLPDRLYQGPAIHLHTGRHADMERSFQRRSAGPDDSPMPDGFLNMFNSYVPDMIPGTAKVNVRPLSQSSALVISVGSPGL